MTEQDLDAMNEEEFNALVENMGQLDELSKKMLGNYINKASSDNRDKARASGEGERVVSAVMGVVNRSKAVQNSLQTSPGRKIAHRILQVFRSNNPNKIKGQLHIMKRTKNIAKAVSKLTKESMTEQTLELINAIDTGSTLDIDASFSELMANKLVDAIENKRVEIATNLFSVTEATGTETKDDKGNVVKWKREGDWKKIDNKDPVGKVTHLSDVARKKSVELKKS